MCKELKRGNNSPFGLFSVLYPLSLRLHGSTLILFVLINSVLIPRVISVVVTLLFLLLLVIIIQSFNTRQYKGASSPLGIKKMTRKSGKEKRIFYFLSRIAIKVVFSNHLEEEDIRRSADAER